MAGTVRQKGLYAEENFSTPWTVSYVRAACWNRGRVAAEFDLIRTSIFDVGFDHLG
jgi:hypothetical protein